MVCPVGCTWVGLAVTQEQKYRVVETLDGVEIREYEPCVVAEITMSGDAGRVGTRAFGPLVGYISKNQIDMTSPVIQERGTESGEWTVAFVLPHGQDREQLPDPQDPRVTLRQVPAQLCAAVRWSGSWKYSEVEKRSVTLEQKIRQWGFHAAGVSRWARYDPPWKPWFARRNEVILPISR